MSGVAAQKPIARKGMKQPVASKKAALAKGKKKGVKKTVRDSLVVAQEGLEKANKNKKEADDKMNAAVNKHFNKNVFAPAVSNDFILTMSRILKVFRDRIDVKTTLISYDPEKMFCITMQYGEKTAEQTIVLNGCVSINDNDLKSVDGMTTFLTFVNKACGVTQEQNFSTIQTLMLFRFTIFCITENTCSRANEMRTHLPGRDFVTDEIIRSKLMELL